MRRRLWPHGRANQSAALAVALAVALVLLIAFPGFGRAPGDPTLFAKDARVDRCGGLDAPVSYIFELPHTRDYRSYLPAMEPSVLLDLDDPSLVVIFQGQGPFTADSSSPAATGPGQPPLHDVCIYVGEAGAGQLDYFPNVSIAGLRVTADGDVIVPAGS